jgi:hypothetical protein
MKESNTKLDQIVIQEKCVGDWRGFISARDSEDNTWELRGIYGETPHEAFQNVMEAYEDADNWDCYGYIITTN